MPPAPILSDPMPTPDHARARPLARWLVAGSLAVGWFGVGPTSPRPANAQAQDAKRGPLDATAAISDVRLVIDIRPAALLKLPIYQKYADQIPDDSKEAKAFKSGAIEQVLILFADFRPGNKPVRPANLPPPLVVLRSSQAYDWKDFLSEKVEEVSKDGITYLRASRTQPGSPSYRVVDDRTLLVGVVEIAVEAIPIGPGARGGRHAWDDVWKQMKPGPVRVAVDAAWLARFVPPGRAGMGFQVVSPLFDQAKAFAMTMDFANGVTLDARATSPDPAGAARVGETLRAILTLARNMVPAIRREVPKGPPQSTQMMGNLIDSLDSTLATAKIEQDQATTRLQLQVDGVTLATATALLLPAVQAAREAARRAESINNLKQIGLAMHEFHNAQGALPAASGVGRDGKTRHSWRVDLLPYLEEVALYNEYNFDEPWDGPNNRKLIERMPKVFHAPSDTNAKPGSPSYFVLTGPDTLFPNRKAGMGFAEVLDGTSNTLAVVEAKRDIPWTKPEDIPVDQDKPLPRLGGISQGGFNTLMADGTVLFLKGSINPVLLRALMTPAGGEVISADQF